LIFIVLIRVLSGQRSHLINQKRASKDALIGWQGM
tara:strand:+ start:46 stop:150 length:105 start_codon:yes stop_codon:yes gene_type:complete